MCSGVLPLTEHMHVRFTGHCKLFLGVRCLSLWWTFILSRVVSPPPEVDTRDHHKGNKTGKEKRCMDGVFFLCVYLIKHFAAPTWWIPTFGEVKRGFPSSVLHAACLSWSSCPSVLSLSEWGIKLPAAWPYYRISTNHLQAIPPVIVRLFTHVINLSVALGIFLSELWKIQLSPLLQKLL